LTKQKTNILIQVREAEEQAKLLTELRKKAAEKGLTGKFIFTFQHDTLYCHCLKKEKQVLEKIAREVYDNYHLKEE